jgi:hypothetical protein
MNNFYYEMHAQSERMKKIKPEFQKLYNAFNHFQRITTSLCATVNETTKEHFNNICEEAEEIFFDELINFSEFVRGT